MPYYECRTRLSCMAESLKQNHPPTSQANPSHPHPVPPPPIQPTRLSGASKMARHRWQLLHTCRRKSQQSAGLLQKPASAGPQSGAADGDRGWNAPGNAGETFASARWTALYGGQAVCLARDKRCGRYRVSADDVGGGGGGRTATVEAEEEAAAAAGEACAEEAVEEETAVAAAACTEKDEAAAEEACAEEKAEKATAGGACGPGWGRRGSVGEREVDSEERGEMERRGKRRTGTGNGRR